MKNLLVFLIVFTITLFALNSCASSNDNYSEDLFENTLKEIANKSNQEVSDFSKLLPDDSGSWTISCNGSCGCTLRHPVGTNNYYCSCNPCSMTISTGKFGNKISKLTKENEESLKSFLINDYDFTSLFDNYLKEKKYKEKDIKILSMEHSFDKNFRFSLFKYIDDKGEVKSVGFTQRLPDPKKFVVDCDGSCGCVEQFNPSTGQVSCSCSPCHMTITEV